MYGVSVLSEVCLVARIIMIWSLLLLATGNGDRRAENTGNGWKQSRKLKSGRGGDVGRNEIGRPGKKGMRFANR